MVETQLTPQGQSRGNRQQEIEAEIQRLRGLQNQTSGEEGGGGFGRGGYNRQIEALQRDLAGLRSGLTPNDVTWDPNTGIPNMANAPSAGQAIDFDLESQRQFLAKQNRYYQDALGSNEQALSTLGGYRAGGAASVAAGLLQGRGQMQLGIAGMLERPDLLGNYRQKQIDDAAYAAKKAARQNRTAAIVGGVLGALPGVGGILSAGLPGSEGVGASGAQGALAGGLGGTAGAQLERTQQGGIPVEAGPQQGPQGGQEGAGGGAEGASGGAQAGGGGAGNGYGADGNFAPTSLAARTAGLNPNVQRTVLAAAPRLVNTAYWQAAGAFLNQMMARTVGAR